MQPAVGFILPLLMRPLYSLETTSDYLRDEKVGRRCHFCVSYKALSAQLHEEELSGPEETRLMSHLGMLSGSPFIVGGS